ALLGKAGGNDHGILDADISALLQRAHDGTGRNDDDCEIDGRADLGDGLEALQPVDIAVVRIDRIDPARIFVLAQHRQQAAGNLGEVARGADQRDAFGCEEAVERMRHAGRVLFVLVMPVKTWMAGSSPATTNLVCNEAQAARRKLTPPMKNLLPLTS